MDPQWLGSFKIAVDLGKVFYALSDIQSGEYATKRVNGAHLKVYHTPLLNSTNPSQDSLNVYTLSGVIGAL